MIIKRLVVVVKRLVVIAKRFYSLIALSSRLTVGVALESRRRANKVVRVLAREKAIAGVAIGTVSLL